MTKDELHKMKEQAVFGKQDKKDAK